MTKEYSFDDHPEHKEQLKPWADKWIANALRTSPMTDTDDPRYYTTDCQYSVETIELK